SAASISVNPRRAPLLALPFRAMGMSAPSGRASDAGRPIGPKPDATRIVRRKPVTATPPWPSIPRAGGGGPPATLQRRIQIPSGHHLAHLEDGQDDGHGDEADDRTHNHDHDGFDKGRHRLDLVL